MAGQTVTLSIPDMLTMEGQAAPVASEIDGNLVLTGTSILPAGAIVRRTSYVSYTLHGHE